MAEITRVPLRPVGKGTLTKLWLGVAAAVLLGAGIAWAAVPEGVTVDELTAGTGPTPAESDVVFVRYVGKLEDGTEFDRSQDPQLPVAGILPEGTPMELSQVVPGFREAVLRMQKGGKYEVEIPSDMAYGATPPPGAPIPPNADLHFEIELIDFMPMQEAQQRLMMLQQMMQQGAPQGQGPGGGAPQPQPQGPPPQ